MSTPAAAPQAEAPVPSPLPKVTIQYCTQCKWLLRAAYVCLPFLVILLPFLYSIYIYIYIYLTLTHSHAHAYFFTVVSSYSHSFP